MGGLVSRGCQLCHRSCPRGLGSGIRDPLMDSRRRDALSMGSRKPPVQVCAGGGMV